MSNLLLSSGLTGFPRLFAYDPPISDLSPPYPEWMPYMGFIFTILLIFAIFIGLCWCFCYIMNKVNWYLTKINNLYDVLVIQRDNNINMKIHKIYEATCYDKKSDNDKQENKE